MTSFRMLVPAASLVALLGVIGCERPAPKPVEHEEAHRTGPHGGTLVTLEPEVVQSAGIAVDSVRSLVIEETAELPGEIRLNAERSVDVRPTYPGTVRELALPLGAFAHRGDSLAVIHSNESLSDYTVTAPMSGTIVARPASLGSLVDANSVLYTVADLGSVWLDFPIYMQNLGHIRPGQTVHVRADGAGSPVTGTIHYVGPVLDAGTRTTFGRVVLANPHDRWRPGSLATAVVVLERTAVPAAVPEEAIVRLGSGSAVFLADSSGFELLPVTTGRSDGTTTEILSGVARGARVVVRNAFLLKAELEKEAGGDED